MPGRSNAFSPDGFVNALSPDIVSDSISLCCSSCCLPSLMGHGNQRPDPVVFLFSDLPKDTTTKAKGVVRTFYAPADRRVFWALFTFFVIFFFRVDYACPLTTMTCQHVGCRKVGKVDLLQYASTCSQSQGM